MSHALSTLLLAAVSVNSTDSRGMLSTNGRTAHPSPAGIPRVSDTDSTCRYNPPSRSSQLH